MYNTYIRFLRTDMKGLYLCVYFNLGLRCFFFECGTSRNQRLWTTRKFEEIRRVEEFEGNIKWVNHLVGVMMRHVKS